MEITLFRFNLNMYIIQVQIEKSIELKQIINNRRNFKRFKGIIRAKNLDHLSELISVGFTLLGRNGNFNWIDTSEITDMHYLFYDSPNFNGHIELWDVSNVTNMKGMFWEAESFNQDISNWDVSNVTNMHHMFLMAESFNQDISKWDVSNVKMMNGMFRYAESFNQDISNWDVKNCKHVDFMFTGSKLDHDNRPKFINE